MVRVQGAHHRDRSVRPGTSRPSRRRSGPGPSPRRSDPPSSYVHNPLTWTDPLGLAPCPKALWEQKADFSSQKVMGKKFYKHAGDFGVTGNRSGQMMKQFEQNMRSHMLAADTKIYRARGRRRPRAPTSSHSDEAVPGAVLNGMVSPCVRAWS